MTATPVTWSEPVAHQHPPAGPRLPSTHVNTAGSTNDLVVASLQAHLADLRRAVDGASALVSQLREPAASQESIHRYAARRVPRWHFSMLNDDQRNSAFAAALRQVVKPGDHVLDIGSGSGLLAMLAVEAGAARVTSCEVDPLLAEIARQVIRSNGLSDRITVVQALSTDLEVGRELAQPADVIVTEIVDCGLIGEGLLPTLRHARQQLLSPGGRLLPQAARVVGAVLSCPPARALNTVRDACGFDVSSMNQVSTPGHFPLRLGTWNYRMMSGQTELFRFDLAHGALENDCRVLHLPITESAVADGLVAWFELDLATGIKLTNAPGNDRSHWMQAYLPFPESRTLAAGDVLRVEISWQDIQLSARPLAFRSSEGGAVA